MALEARLPSETPMLYVSDGYRSNEPIPRAEKIDSWICARGLLSDLSGPMKELKEG
jgi:hypothetical protein